MDRTRPLTETERDTLNAALRRLRGRRGARALVTPLAMVGTAIASAAVVPSVAAVLITVAATLALGAWAATALRRPQSAPADDALAGKLAQDLAAGRARETRHRASAAWMLEREAETASAFLRLADGGVLFLGGAYLARAIDEGRFPRAEVIVARSPEAGLVLGVHLDGPPLPPAGQERRFRREVIAGGRRPSDCDVLAIRWEDVETFLAPAPAPLPEESAGRHARQRPEDLAVRRS